MNTKRGRGGTDVQMIDKPNCSIPECETPSYVRGWCQPHYRSWRLHGDPLAVKRCPQGTANERFWAKVDKRGDEECWPWLAQVVFGYGRFRVSSKRGTQAHRVSWEFIHGPIPEGMHLDHLCHTLDESCVAGNKCLHRRCVNPAHLELVTPLENVHRGRSPAMQIVRSGFCAKGHPWDDQNSYTDEKGRRVCNACKREANARKRLKFTSQGLTTTGTVRIYPLERVWENSV